MPEARESSLKDRLEKPLLGLDNDYAMADFWSLRKLPAGSMAPPSSPRLHASSLDPEPDNGRCLPSPYQTMSHLNQQLVDQLSNDDVCQNRVVSCTGPSLPSSWQTGCSSSSDDNFVATKSYIRHIPYPDDDGATLVNVLSGGRSSCSEANTILGDSMDNSHMISPRWKESLAQLDHRPCRTWSATVPARRPATSRAHVTRWRDPPAFHTPDYKALCPSRRLASKAISSTTLRCTSIEPTLSPSSPRFGDPRANSWPGSADDLYSPGCTSPMPPEISEKSSWDPDSSDDERETAKQKEQSMGRLRQKIGRRVSDTLRPLLCRS